MDPRIDGLTAAQHDRATGAIVGMAVGNALGNGYAFDPRTAPESIVMRAGGLGPYNAGEWADDMAMSLPLLDLLAAGRDLNSEAAQDEVAAAWANWFATAKDVAPIIGKVLSAYEPERGAASLRDKATQIYSPASTPAGNASLMRTTPLTLGFLHDPDGLAAASRAYSALTHASPQAADACVLWNLAQREAVLTGTCDLAAGLPWVPDSRQGSWEQLFIKAEIGLPQDFAFHNGLVTSLVQTVWSAINLVEDDGPEHFEKTLRLVIGAGGDTATAGAVAGGLLGARWGVSAIPLKWRRYVHGWPGITDADLIRAVWQVLAGKPWPAQFGEDTLDVPVFQHPADPGVWLGGATGVRPLPATVDAVVSLCDLGVDQMPLPALPPTAHVRVWLNDSDDPRDNPHLELVAEQATRIIMDLRNEGSNVYVHCMDGRSRTPFIAALYGARVGGAAALEMLGEIQSVAPAAEPNALFRSFLRGA